MPILTFTTTSRGIKETVILDSFDEVLANIQQHGTTSAGLFVMIVAELPESQIGYNKTIRTFIVRPPTPIPYRWKYRILHH